MIKNDFGTRRKLEQLDADKLAAVQLQKLNQLLAAILPHNKFYASKLGAIELTLTSLEALSALPFTFKDELVYSRYNTLRSVNCIRNLIELENHQIISELKNEQTLESIFTI